MDDWKRREQDRFTFGEYDVVPWIDEVWWQIATMPGGKAEFHFAHRSKSDTTLIAYTENDAKGIADRQTSLKPGRYLNRYFPELGAPTIAKMAALFNTSGTEVLFATTEDEWERVYTKGPGSCMAGEASEYDSPFHPVRVYARGGDLQLAYLVNEGEITARSIVFPKEKTYSRIYGDEYRLEAELKKLGYSGGRRDGALCGAKIAKVRCSEYGELYVMPYVDWHGVEDAGDHFVIVAEGEGDVDGHSTSGVIDTDRTICYSCDDPIRSGNEYHVSGNDYCRYCYEENFENCDYCHDTVERCETVTVDGNRWCEHCADRHAVMCEHCEELSTSTVDDINGNSTCEGCADDMARCEDSSAPIPRGEECGCEECLTANDGQPRSTDALIAEREARWEAEQERRRAWLEAERSNFGANPEAIERSNGFEPQPTAVDAPDPAPQSEVPGALPGCYCALCERLRAQHHQATLDRMVAAE